MTTSYHALEVLDGGKKQCYQLCDPSVATIAVKAPRINSYAVNVTAAEGAAFSILGRLPL